MSGVEYLALAERGLSELGIDDPGVRAGFEAAIDSGDLDTEQMARACFGLGHCHHGTDEQAEAKGLLEQCISLSTDPLLLALAHYELGETYFALGQERIAEEHFRKSLEHNRQHTFAPDTLLLLGRVAYMRAAQEGNLQLLEECYGYFDEAIAMLESPDSERYGDAFGRQKTLFDLYTGKGVCKAAMPRDNERFEAARYFEQAEKIALEHPEAITRQELLNVYTDWAKVYKSMGLEREVELVLDRVKRNIG